MTKIIRTKKFIEWILNQPDDRPVDMRNTFNKADRCGCVMIEYAKDHEMDITNVAYVGFYKTCVDFYKTCHLNALNSKLVTRLEFSIDKIIKSDWSEIRTFKDVKEKIDVDILKECGMMPES